MYIKIGGQYKYGIPWVKVDGVWRCGTTEYIKDFFGWFHHPTFDDASFDGSINGPAKTETLVALENYHEDESTRLYNQFTLNSDGTVTVNRTEKYHISCDIEADNFAGTGDTTCNFKLYAGSSALINQSFSVPRTVDIPHETISKKYEWTGTINKNSKLKTTARFTDGASEYAVFIIILSINGMPP